jgi:hypothetical protein
LNVTCGICLDCSCTIGLKVRSIKLFLHPRPQHVRKPPVTYSHNYIKFPLRLHCSSLFTPPHFGPLFAGIQHPSSSPSSHPRGYLHDTKEGEDALACRIVATELHHDDHDQRANHGMVLLDYPQCLLQVLGFGEHMYLTCIAQWTVNRPCSQMAVRRHRDAQQRYKDVRPFSSPFRPRRCLQFASCFGPADQIVAQSRPISQPCSTRHALQIE